MPDSRSNDYHVVTTWTMPGTCEEVSDVLGNPLDLPRWLRWEFEVVESRYPHGFTIVADGDFDGTGTWTFEQRGPAVDITFDWRIRAEKPLRWLSFLFKPIFAANHRWAMAQGEICLRRELSSRRG